MILRSGRSLRARLATRSEKSGLSMVTSASGAIAATASPVSRMRRSRFGSRGSTSAMPITESSSIGKRLASPSAAIAGPPTPVEREAVAAELAQPGDQRAAEQVARGLAGDEEEPRSRPHPAQPRVEQVAQAVAHQVQAEHGQDDGEARERARARARARSCVWLSASIRPQDGRRRLRAEPDIGEAGLGEDAERELDGALHDQQVRDVGQDVLDRDPRRALAGDARRQDEVARPERQRAAPRVSAREDRDVEDADGDDGVDAPTGRRPR